MSGVDPQAPKVKVDSRWIASALLLLMLSMVPFLLPMADSSPSPPKPDASPVVARKHSRVVVMIVDGLGYGKAVRSHLMPHMEVRMAMSAFGMALASFPSITPTGLRAIMSGHRMASEPQLPTGMKTWPELDSVMARASAAGLKTFVVGQFTWPPLFPGLHGADFIEIPYKGPKLKYEYGKKSMLVDYDALVLEKAAPIIEGKQGPWDLLILHIFETDSIAHAVGTEDPLYTEHLPSLDSKIEELSRQAQEDRATTFLLLADHGQAADGAHGGLSDVERQVPFMMWGAGVKPGDLGTLPLYNAAPTICALLGIPPPVETEGWPMLSGMQLSERSAAQALLDLARQRQQRWEAVKRVLPGLAGDPRGGIAEVVRLLSNGQDQRARARAEHLVKEIDASIADALPESWLWRIVAALWAVVLASSFGLAWRQEHEAAAAATAALSAACLLALAIPLLRPSSWAWVSAFVVAGCLGVLLLTVRAGAADDSGLGRYGWFLWWTALAGIAAQNVIDTSLWAWLIVIGLFAGRAMHLTRDNARTTAISAAAFLACAVASLADAPAETSWLRSHLPALHWRELGLLDWRLAAYALLALLAGAAYVPFGRLNDDRRPLAAYLCAVGPLVVGFGIVAWRPDAGAWAWVAGLASLTALLWQRPSATVRGMWLSAIFLSYYRTMADDRQWCMLAMAVVMGLALSWKTRDANPLWEGLGLLGIGLWSFFISGGRLSFSSITVAEGYRVLGTSWHPYALMAVVALKPLAAIGAPIMPRFSSRPLYSLLGILPPLGALAAGNLSWLLVRRAQLAGNLKFTDQAGFSQMTFVLVLAWCVMGLWAALRGLDLLSAKLSGQAAG